MDNKDGRAAPKRERPDEWKSGEEETEEELRRRQRQLQQMVHLQQLELQQQQQQRMMQQQPGSPPQRQQQQHLQQQQQDNVPNVNDPYVQLLRHRAERGGIQCRCNNRVVQYRAEIQATGNLFF